MNYVLSLLAVVNTVWEEIEEKTCFSVEMEPKT